MFKRRNVMPNPNAVTSRPGTIVAMGEILVEIMATRVGQSFREPGTLIGPFASLFEADIGRAAERQAAHLRRPSNAVGQIPCLDATGRDPHRQSLAALIRNPIRRLRRTQSLNCTTGEQQRAACQSGPKSHYLESLLCSLCRSSVATLSQQNRRLEANQRERRRMVTYCLTNTNCARANCYERPRTAIQWLAAPFPIHSCPGGPTPWLRVVHFEKVNPDIINS